MSVQVALGLWNCLGRETVDASGGEEPLANIPAGADFAVIATATAGARYTQDGSTTPTSSVGLPCAQYEKIIINTPLADLQLYGGSFEVVYYSA